MNTKFRGDREKAKVIILGRERERESSSSNCLDSVCTVTIVAFMIFTPSMEQLGSHRPFPMHFSHIADQIPEILAVQKPDWLLFI